MNNPMARLRTSADDNKMAARWWKITFMIEALVRALGEAQAEAVRAEEEAVRTEEALEPSRIPHHLPVVLLPLHPQPLPARRELKGPFKPRHQPWWHNHYPGPLPEQYRFEYFVVPALRILSPS